MKILHTADWHIGQFKGPVVDGVNLRLQDTVKCLEYMVEVAQKEKPDIVCISGDIFHQEQIGPVRYSDEMIIATDTITKLADIAKGVIVMRGTPNHDGSGQFRVLDRMFAKTSHVHIITAPTVLHTPYTDIACIPGFDKQEFRAKFPGLSADEENLAWTKYISDMVFALRAECEKTPILIGWKCGLVVANSAADYENIYNLTNAIEYAGEELTIPQSTAWLAGAAAAAGYTTSLTYTTVTGATGVVGTKTNEESIQAIKKGETFFTISESGDVILEYDVNSKVTFTQDDPTDILKGRPCRVYDSFANDLLLTFVPGRFNNDPTGWTVMEGLGRAILKAYQNDGAIQNVDEENDFLVDRGASTGDSVYISCGIQPVDSAEKYYFTVIAR